MKTVLAEIHDYSTFVVAIGNQSLYSSEPILTARVDRITSRKEEEKSLMCVSDLCRQLKNNLKGHFSRVGVNVTLTIQKNVVITIANTRAYSKGPALISCMPCVMEWLYISWRHSIVLNDKVFVYCTLCRVIISAHVFMCLTIEKRGREEFDVCKWLTVIVSDKEYISQAIIELKETKIYHLQHYPLLLTTWSHWSNN